MRSWMAVGVVVLAMGCGAPPRPSAVTPGGCTDPTGCTESNGTGVYYQEGGFAGIGPSQMMITHFINGTSRVMFQGRYFNATDGHWYPLTEVGQVYRADYHPAHAGELEGGTNLEVVSVHEAGTVPTWTLLDPRRRRSILVPGAELTHLTLLIAFSVPIQGQRQFELTFEGPEITSGRLHAYRMRWRELGSAAPAAAYCFDARRAPDAVVFQQGIDVDPVRGRVQRGPSADQMVTMSCSLGAPATVFRWGYDHGTQADAFYFDAGIHMKRAAYCGDQHYYTHANTEIQISDDRPHGQDQDRIAIEASDIRNLEAWWTPTGASCVNGEVNGSAPDHPTTPDNRRHRNFASHGAKFNGSCGGVQKPRCELPSKNHRQRYLIDGANPPAP